ncbi:hypothetical protein ACFP3I_12350 [Chryseobacterium arachidis]
MATGSYSELYFNNRRKNRYMAGKNSECSAFTLLSAFAVSYF